METILINPAYELTKQILVALGCGDPYRASLRKFWQDSNANGVIDILDYVSSLIKKSAESNR